MLEALRSGFVRLPVYLAWIQGDSAVPYLLATELMVSGSLKEKSMIKAEYHQYFVAWAGHQVALLKAGRTDELDVENLIEEMEAMSHKEHRCKMRQTNSDGVGGAGAADIWKSLWYRAVRKAVRIG